MTVLIDNRDCALDEFGVDTQDFIPVLFLRLLAVCEVRAEEQEAQA